MVTFENLSTHGVQDIALVVETADLAKNPLYLGLGAPNTDNQNRRARDDLAAELLPWSETCIQVFVFWGGGTGSGGLY